MEELALKAVKLCGGILASMGLAFHLLALSNPGKGEKLEQRLSTEFGCRKRFITWLEGERKSLHERLMKSKAYHILATIFLMILLTLLIQL